MACLLIIGDYTLRIRRWLLKRRQLRWMQDRIVHLDPSSAVPTPDESLPSTDLFQVSPENEQEVQKTQEHSRRDREIRELWDLASGKSRDPSRE